MLSGIDRKETKGDEAGGFGRVPTASGENHRVLGLRAVTDVRLEQAERGENCCKRECVASTPFLD